MSSLRSLVGAGAGSLARRIDRLRNTLHLLSEKLREAVSTAIGQEVAEAVRQGLRSTDRPYSSPPVDFVKGLPL